MAFDLGKLKSFLSADFSKSTGGQVIGIDIGSSAMKIVQFHLEGETPTLDTYGELQLGPYADLLLGDTVRLEPKRLTEALVDIVREASATANTAALSISSASSFVTTLTVNTTDDDEIAKRVPVEARKYIPVSLTEVTLDWFPLSQDATKNETTLLLVAIYNESLTVLTSVLSGAGLSIAYTELEPFSAIRSSLAPEDTHVALIDLGASATKLYIVKSGVLQKTHILHPSGKELTETLARSLSINFADAEMLKRTVGITDDGVHTAGITAMRNSLERGAKELDKVIDAYEVQFGVQVGKVFLLGGGALTPGLTPFLQDILQRTVIVSEPFSKVAFPAFLEDTLKEAGPSFAVAVGTALRSFLA